MMLFQIVLYCLLTAQLNDANTVISGVVLDARDQPVADATVDARSSLWWVGDNFIEPKTTRTDANGNFRFELPIEKNLLPMITLSAQNKDQTEIGICPISQLGEDASEAIRLRLSKPQTIRLQVQDSGEQPIEGAITGLTIKVAGILASDHRISQYDNVYLEPKVTDAVGVAEYQIPQNAQVLKTVALKQGYSLASSDFATADPRATDTATNVSPSFPASGIELLVIDESPPTTIQIVGANRQPVANATVRPQFGFDAANGSRIRNVLMLGNASRQQTNANGEANFTWLPKSGSVAVWVEAEGYESGSHTIELRGSSESSIVELQPLVPIGGRVQLDTGQLLSEVELTAIGVAHSPYASKVYSATTDAGGTFSMHVPVGRVYQIIVNDPDWAAEVQTNVVTSAEAPTKELIFTARKPTKLFGRVTEEESGDPIAGVQLQVTYRDECRATTDAEGFTKPAGNSRTRTDSQKFETTTDAEGWYSFALGDGKYSISLRDGSGGSQDFDIQGQDSQEIELWTTIQPTMQYRLTGQVIEHGNGRPLPWAQIVLGVSNHTSNYAGAADHQGRFETTITWTPRRDGPKEVGPISVFGASADGKLFGVLELIRPVDHCTLPLAPPTSMSGQLIGPDDEIPWGNAQIRYRQIFTDKRLPNNVNTGSVTTDEEGNFRIDNLTSGQQYELLYEPEPEQAATGSQQRFGLSRPISRTRPVSLGTVTATNQNSESIKVRIPTPIGSLSGPSMNERVSRLFAKRKDALRAFRTATANPANRPLIVLIGGEDDPRTLEIMKYRLQHVGRQTNRWRGYRLLLISKAANEAAELAVELGETLDETSDLMMVVLDQQNIKLKTIDGNDIFLRDKLSLPRLDRFLQVPPVSP